MLLRRGHSNVMPLAGDQFLALGDQRLTLGNHELWLTVVQVEESPVFLRSVPRVVMGFLHDLLDPCDDLGMSLGQIMFLPDITL